MGFPSSHVAARQMALATSPPRNVGPRAMCARSQFRPVPSSMARRLRLVTPLTSAPIVAGTAPTMVHQPAAAREDTSKMRPSASKASDDAVRAIVKWVKIGCIGDASSLRESCAIALPEDPWQDMAAAPEHRDPCPATTAFEGHREGFLHRVRVPESDALCLRARHAQRHEDALHTIHDLSEIGEDGDPDDVA